MKQGFAMKPGPAVYLVAFVTSLLLIPSASATWSGSKSMGKTPTLGEPSCVQIAAKEVVCLAQSQQNTLMANEFSNGAWSGWTNLPGAVSSDPSCAVDSSSNVVCGVRSGTTGTLVATVFDGTNWSAFIDSKGAVFSAPSCALQRNSKILCAAKSVTSTLGESVFNTTTNTWGAFKSVAATLTSAPSCANDSDGDVICAMNALVSATNDTIVVNRFDGSKWAGFLTLQGGISGNSPSCTTLGVKGQVVCFDRANNTAYYANMFKSGIWQTSNWTGWRGITGGAVAPGMSCGMPAAGSLACGVLNLADSFLYTATFDGTNWTSFAKVGTKPIADGPFCSDFGGGQVICATIGLNNQASSLTGP